MKYYACAARRLYRNGPLSCLYMSWHRTRIPHSYHAFHSVCRTLPGLLVEIAAVSKVHDCSFMHGHLREVRVSHCCHVTLYQRNYNFRISLTNETVVDICDAYSVFKAAGDRGWGGGRIRFILCGGADVSRPACCDRGNRRLRADDRVCVSSAG